MFISVEIPKACSRVKDCLRIIKTTSIIFLVSMDLNTPSHPLWDLSILVFVYTPMSCSERAIVYCAYKASSMHG